MPNEGRLAERKKRIALQGQEGARENPNIGKPFRRYIGGDEVQKRAQNFSMFNRPPVVAPSPTGPGGAPRPSGPGGILPQMPPQNPGINPNQMYSNLSQAQPVSGQPMSAGPGGILPQQQQAVQRMSGMAGGSIGGATNMSMQNPGGTPMPQVTGMPGQRMLNSSQPIPQVPRRPMQYSLANRGWGPNSK